MKIISEPRELTALSRQWSCAGERVGFVPTMGYFHEGHLALMDEAVRRADKVVVSLFVNPSQFGPGEDFEDYPRDFERDAELAAARGVDVVFHPTPEAMYPEGDSTWVEVPRLARGLCAGSRPTHFRGVATVVTKLFQIAQPDIAVFGEKDWQQLAIIRRMTRDLHFGVEIIGHPIVREDDGLAMSSRNVYLTPIERSQAPGIYAGLRIIRERFANSRTPAREVLSALAELYCEHVPAGSIDYMEMVDPESMEPRETLDGPTLLAVAVKFSKARLLDNILLQSGAEPGRE